MRIEAFDAGDAESGGAHGEDILDVRNFDSIAAQIWTFGDVVA